MGAMRSGTVRPPPDGTTRDATSRCRAGVPAYGHVVIDRFTDLLHELSEETQSVLIRYSKRTMEAAQALYGVTRKSPASPSWSASGSTGILGDRAHGEPAAPQNRFDQQANGHG